MKKEFLLVGLAALAALTISSCTKEQYIEDEVQKDKSGQVISLFATTAQVKTAIDNDDALAVNWVEGDKISVFIPSAGSDVYGDNYEFTADPENLEKGHFTGSTGTLSESNDWYVLYPSKEGIPSPAGNAVTVPASFVFGSDANVAQVQSGNDNTSHLAGANMPLYGKALSIAKGTTPKIPMHQAAAVVKIVVTNANTEPLTVQTVQFTANEEIAGMFAIDITGETPSYTKCSTASHVSKTASLTVEDGTALVQSVSASFYLAIKPFVAEKGSTLKVSVNGYEKDLNMPEDNDVTFAAGKIKQITFNYNPTAPEEYELVPSLDDITDGLYVIANGGYLLPNTEVTSGNGPAAISIEGTATIEGTTLKTNSENIVWKFEGTNSAMAVRSYANEANYLYNSSNSSNTGVRVSSDGNGKTWTFAVNNEGFSMTNNGRFCAKYKNGSDWRSYGSADHGNYADGGQLKLYKRESTDPTIKADDIVGIPATGGEQHTTYEIKNIDTDDVAATFDGTVVTSATASAGNVTYTVAPNYTLKDVTTGTITLTSASTGASKTISVSQDASVFEVDAPDEITLANTKLATGTFTIKSTFPGTISIDDETNFTVDNTYAASAEGQERTVMTNGVGDPVADRTATIKITRQGLADVTIPVRQYKSGNMPLAAPADLTVAKHNENDGVKVTWTCSDNNVTSYVWIISTESTATAAEGDANAVTGSVTAPIQNFTSEASNFSVNTTYHLYVKSTSDKTGFEDSDYVTETFTIDPKQDNAFDFSAQGYANQQEIGVVQLDDNIKATFNTGEGSNSPKYYTTGSAVRLYAKGTLTIGASAATKAVTNELLITKIVITFASGDDGNTITANNGTYSESNGTGTWTGSASSVVFTVGGNSGNRRIKTISVDYTGGIPPVFVSGVSLDKTSIELAEGKTATLVATVAPDDAKNKNVTWSSSEESVATVDQDGKVTAVAPGSATITVTTEDGSKTATCDVTVTEAPKYYITIADGITGGTVESSHAQAAEGTEVTLTVTPDADYELDKLTVDGSEESVTGNEYKFNMPAHDVAVSASFMAIPVLSTMDAIFAAATTAASTATDARVKFNDWVVSGVKGSNAYLTDNNGKGLIIYSSGHGFDVGDILSGTVDCKVQLYNESAELTALISTSTGLTVTKGGTVAPATISIANLSGVNTGAVITFESLTYNGSEFSDGVNTIKPYNTFISLPALTFGNNYKVTGMYIQYKDTKQIAPRTNDDIVSLTPYLNATASTTSIPADGGTVTITVDTNIEGWTVFSDNAEFVVGDKNGKTVPVVVSKNTSTTEGRTAHITVSATGVKDVEITLSQSKKSSGEGPAVGTAMWSETWQGGDKDETPSSYGQEGTVVYDGGSVTYTQSSLSTKLYNDTMATTNLLLAKSNGTWTISGIPTGGKAKLTLEFETNNTTKTRYNLSSTTTGVSIGEVSTSGSGTPYKATAVISISGNVDTFDLTFKNTTTNNVRLDNLSIKVAE